jgi:hypothetical protein
LVKNFLLPILVVCDIVSNNTNAVQEVLLVRFVRLCIPIRYFENETLILVVSLRLTIQDIVDLIFFYPPYFYTTGKTELANSSFSLAGSFI